MRDGKSPRSDVPTDSIKSARGEICRERNIEEYREGSEIGSAYRPEMESVYNESRS